jgi:hypothetical protein
MHTREEHSPLSNSLLENIIQIAVLTATSDDEAREKAKRTKRIRFFYIWIYVWCKHLVEVWRDCNIEPLSVNMSYNFLV